MITTYVWHKVSSMITSNYGASQCLNESSIRLYYTNKKTNQGSSASAKACRSFKEEVGAIIRHCAKTQRTHKPSCAGPGVREHETEQWAVARLDPAVRARESRQRAVARGKKTYPMVCTCKNGEYLFHQPCGLWNEPCVHGCGYIHLSNSTPGTRKKCCVNGQLSSASDNFEEGLI